MEELLIGSHVDMKAPDFVFGCVKQAVSYHANTFMFYTGAPQNSIRRPISELKKQEAHQAMKEAGIDPKNVVVHAPYIINLANVINKELWEKSKAMLYSEVQRTAELGFSMLVLHPGAHMKQGSDVAIQQLVDSLNDLFRKDHSSVVICIETMAGKGSEIGITLEEVAQIIHGVEDKKRIGVCLDTCHLSDGGYDLSSWEKFLQKVSSTVGIENVRVIHLNDSKNPRGSHKDRHENIGYGAIGFDTLYRIVHEPLFHHIPKILETPYVGDFAPYGVEIEALRVGQAPRLPKEEK